MEDNEPIRIVCNKDTIERIGIVFMNSEICFFGGRHCGRYMDMSSGRTTPDCENCIKDRVEWIEIKYT